MSRKPALATVILFLFISVSSPADRHEHEHSDRKTVQSISRNDAADDCVVAKAQDECLKKLARRRPKVPEHFCSIVPRGANDVVCSDCNMGTEVHAAKPCYPKLARIGRASGVVHVEVVADEKGKVVWARVVDGHPLLQAASLNAACQTTFVPFKCNGRVIKLVRHLFYKFTLS